jgi:mannose/cellobiose epimerase-like protein (N-acyl-D-glucosamine 2-epimerase family)
MDTSEFPEDRLRRGGSELSRWLVQAAYPLWARRGFDCVHGGFHESLDGDGQPAYEPRRLRVQVRQVYSFARAPEMGWQGDAAALVTAGLAYVRTHYRRPDGLFRNLVAPDGSSLDDRALLYDQAFVLLALAASQRVLGPQADLISEATQLRELLYRFLKRPDRGFNSGLPEAGPLLANPHMHLLEAALAWTHVSDDPRWRRLVDELVELALERLIDPDTGALRERFTGNWSPLESAADPPVEPGHLFEWAWLLLQSSAGASGVIRSRAQRLVEIGEEHGVREGIVVNSLREDLAISDSAARLWPQTERLKATVSLARLTQHSRYWSAADAAVAALSRFLATPTRGLWHDWLTADGYFTPERAPASSFYHIVCAIAELVVACPAPAATSHTAQCPRDS